MRRVIAADASSQCGPRQVPVTFRRNKSRILSLLWVWDARAPSDSFQKTFTPNQEDPSHDPLHHQPVDPHGVTDRDLAASRRRLRHALPSPVVCGSADGAGRPTRGRCAADGGRHAPPWRPFQPPPPRELPTVPAGSQLTLPANFLGPQPGSVLMVFSDIKLPVQVDRWDTTGVTITLPPMAIKDAVVIRVDVVLPNGKLGHTQELRVTAPAPVVLHPVSPAPPLPTQPTIAASRQQAVGCRPSSCAGRRRRVRSSCRRPRAASAAAARPSSGQLVRRGLPMQGNGTPDRPFVLPAAQPVNAASAAAPQPTAAAVLDVPTADAVDDDAWLENNPILQEGVPTDPSVIPPADVTSPMSDPELGDAVQPSAPISARGVTTALSIFAQILLSK